MTEALKNWLQTPCAPEDLLELTKGIFYMPIGTVKKKIQHMEDKFSVVYLEANFHHFLFNSNKHETIASGSIGITLIQDGEIVAQLIGTATFPISYYGENTHYAATLESLCIVNAFGAKYPQFGSVLNSTDVVAPASRQLAKVPKENIDKVTDQLFNALKKKLAKFASREEAQLYLDGTEFKFNIEAKAIVNNLPLKKQ